METRRSGGIVTGHLFAGDVEGANVFIVDDMIGTGKTMLRAAEACRQRGANWLPMPDRGCEAALAHPAIDRTIVTDTASPFHISEDVLRSVKTHKLLGSDLPSKFQLPRNTLVHAQAYHHRVVNHRCDPL